jgi:hypothetical protein
VFLSGSFCPLEAMPRFLQTFAGRLPRHDLDEGLPASIGFVHCVTAPHHFVILGTFAAVVFVVGSVTFSSASPENRPEEARCVIP